MAHNMANTQDITWDIVPHMHKNFRCYMINNGRWDRGAFKNPPEIGPEYGKWIFKIEQVGPGAPTLGDQRNFLTGLFEMEWRNDNHILKNGKSRPPQRLNKIDMFIKILEQLKERPDVKDTEKGMEYYINLFNNEER